MHDKILFLQLESGAAGDMLAAALLGLVPDPEASIARLRALVPPGVALTLRDGSREGLAGKIFDVSVNGEVECAHGHNHEHAHEHECDHGEDHDHEHTHEHEHAHEHSHEHTHSHEHAHHHHHATLENVRAHILSLSLDDKVRNDALAVFDSIADAEAKAHGRPVDQIHFHEVGTLDAIADVICVCSLIAEIAPDLIVATPPNAGGGTVRCAHGILPVPAPATANLLEGLPWHGDDPSAGELLTPTGAALLRHFVANWGSQPLARWNRTGIGLGHRETPGRSNAVRAFLGESVSATPETSSSGPNGRITELLCNIDDMTGEALGRACERLRALPGVVDVAVSAIQVKKNRPGHLLRLLCATTVADTAAAAILRETSTFGVRRADMSRYELDRRFENRPAPGGGQDIPWKIGTGYGVEKAKPEFDAIN